MEPIQETGQYKQAVITSLRLLAASPKSGTELEKKLISKGFAAPVVAQALKDLTAQGVLDESVYAQDLVTRLTQSSGVGKYRVAFELKRHGVPRKIRDELLGALNPDEEAARALEMARLKWPAWQKLESHKRKKRLYDFLIRKGYDFQIAQDVLAKLDKESLSDGI